ncbi:inactive glucose-6-phosphate 1-dehydrogenase 4 [Populus alba x Populus x berolinensis]|nr:inactive glucose-6-phosphate 1-dehydrogenase 4 [Populus alba x Populus x berolinensis]
MSLFFPTLSIPSWDSSTSRPISPCSSSLKDPPSSLQVNEILPYKLVTRNFGGGGGICRRFCGLKLWMIQRFNIWQMNRKSGPLKEFMTTKNQNFPNVPLPSHSLNYPTEGGRGPSLCIAVIGATGELAKGEIFPALFALYYNGFLSEDAGIFGYSRKNLTVEDLRSIIASTLTCRIDHQYGRTAGTNGGFP